MKNAMRNVLMRASSGHAVRFWLVGGLSFGIDLGLLTLLKEGFHVDLWIATPIAFVVSLLFNFWAQRVFTFRATNHAHVSFLKYSVLVVFNIFATDLIVNWISLTAAGYGVGKVVATGVTTVWNFYLYKYWIFRGASVPTPHLESSTHPALDSETSKPS
jgi:putative flippase GtrA